MARRKYSCRRNWVSITREMHKKCRNGGMRMKFGRLGDAVVFVSSEQVEVVCLLVGQTLKALIIF